MKHTLFRYVLREVLGPFVIGLVILTFVLLMFQILKLTELIISYGVKLGDVGRMLLYIFPPFFTFTIPISFLLAVLLAISRLSSDSEITALKAGGISLKQLYPPILVFSLLTTALTAGLSLYADPWGKAGFKNLLIDLGHEKATVLLVEHVFNDSLKDMTLYVHHIVPEEERLEGIFLADDSNPDQPIVITAREGRLVEGEGETTLALEFRDGVMHHTDAADPLVYDTVQFNVFRFQVDLAQAMPDKQLQRTYLEMNMKELREYAHGAPQNQDEYDRHRAWVEYHRRIAFPFVCLVFGLVALPLGVSPPRTGRSRGFSTSIGVLCIFYLLFRAGENLAWKKALHPIPAMWGPNLLMLGLGAYLLWKKTNERPIWLLDNLSYLANRAGQWLRRKAGFAKAEGEDEP